MSKYASKVDWIPSFWNFLSSLNRDDLIAELIQNDLDQDATFTKITFEKDQLICYGNGKPVDLEGWHRLSFIQGAGDQVLAKRGKIGVKNHGLKTAFTLGDRLHLMSDGKSIEQTLYAKENKQDPHPGASKNPTVDSQAPLQGCRIVIPYRAAILRPQTGEKISWQVPTPVEIEKLFQNACSNIPEQFIGIVSPERVTSYRIELKHWRLGNARFNFSCTRGRKIKNKRIESFRRKCSVDGGAQALPDTLYEQAVRRLIPLRGQLKARCPDFYRKGKQFTAEVSWATNKSGKPLARTGRFRYPIGYPPDSQEAYTGHGSSFNVPIISNSERHAPVANEETNYLLRTICDKLLVDALTCYTIPRWRADGLIPLVPNSTVENAIEIVSPLLTEIVNRKKLPLLSWHEATKASTKSQRIKQSLHQLSRRKFPQEEKRYVFIIPHATWEDHSFNPTLSALCPRSEIQLDPRTPAELVKILTDYIYDKDNSNNSTSFDENNDFTAFDENDVICRITSDDNKWFGAIPNRRKEFAEPVLAKHYLDLIALALDNKSPSITINEDDLFEKLQLPDNKCQAQNLGDLYSSNLLLSDIPGLDTPPILHPDILKHPLLKRKKWRRQKFTMRAFLDSDSLQNADEEIRGQFWKWLQRNSRLVSRQDRTQLACLAIWPDHDDHLTTLSNLCAPSTKKVQSILAGCIRQPNKEIQHSGLVTFGKRGRMSIRSIPTTDEIGNWLNWKLNQFELGSVPESDEVQALNRFEDELCILVKDKKILNLLRKIETTPIPALAKDGTIQARSELIGSNDTVRRLSLPARYLLHSTKANSPISKIEPTLSDPTIPMLIDSLSEDPTNSSSLQSRLRLLLKLCDTKSDTLEVISKLDIIPVNGKFRKPSELAFKGNKGDYWGDWKEKIPATDLSQDEQSRYLEIGVTSSVPNPEVSREFFKWVANLENKKLEKHIPCIFRHILHKNGPTSWAQSFTDISFLPVRTMSAVKLASQKEVDKHHVYLPDFEGIGKEIILRDKYVMVVIQSVKEVALPITEQCRDLGVKSLRLALNKPESVYNADEKLNPSKDIQTELNKLQSRKIRNTLSKRLINMGVPSDLIYKNWHHRLKQIKNIQTSTAVKARYRFRRKVYDLNVDAEFDIRSKVFWIKSASNLGPSEMYEAIAKYVIFEPSALPMHHLALEHAVNKEISDPSFAQSQKDDVNDDSSYETDLEDESADTAEAIKGHAPYSPDPKRNLPNPSPIPAIPTRSNQEKIGRQKKTQTNGKTSPTPEIEKEHINNLKSNQYASHCQICLSTNTPIALAPKGSYIYEEEVRRSIIEAHHADLKSGGGARHAGNLILLCKYHHDNYGRRFTRSKVTESLREKFKSKTISFGENHQVEGKLIEYTIPDDGNTITIFFTNNHAEFWLKNAQK